jgi:hypothetical protein
VHVSLAISRLYYHSTFTFSVTAFTNLLSPECSGQLLENAAILRRTVWNLNRSVLYNVQRSNVFVCDRF